MSWWSFERRWLAAIWETLLPSGTPGGLALGARDVPLDRFLDELLACAPLRVTLGARVCVWLLTFCPLLVIGRFARFPALAEEERLAVLEKLCASDLYLVRELPTLFKMLGALGFAGLPAVHAEMGITVRDSTPPDWAREGKT
jgi:hypothetical protein